MPPTTWGNTDVKPETLPEIAKVLEAMQEIELAIGSFYRTCAEVWPEEREFWAGLESQEQGHAENLQRMAALLAEHAGAFEVQRPFNLIALQTIKAGIEARTRQVRQGEYSHDQTLYAARDLEQSLVEAKYGEFLKTTHPEYQTLAKEIASQTALHLSSLTTRIASGPRRSA